MILLSEKMQACRKISIGKSHVRNNTNVQTQKAKVEIGYPLGKGVKQERRFERTFAFAWYTSVLKSFIRNNYLCIEKN